MRVLKDQTTESTSKSHWDAIIDPGTPAPPFAAGDRVQTLSGGRELIVETQVGSDVRCRVGHQVYGLPRSMLRLFVATS